MNSKTTDTLTIDPNATVTLTAPPGNCELSNIYAATQSGTRPRQKTRRAIYGWLAILTIYTLGVITGMIIF